MGGSYIELQEKVPLDYRRLYLFFGEDDFRSCIVVDGKEIGQRLFTGCAGEPGVTNLVNLMDWEASVIEEIRTELKGYESS